MREVRDRWTTEEGRELETTVDEMRRPQIPALDANQGLIWFPSPSARSSVIRKYVNYTKYA